jgi:hypothetical protein
MSSVRERVVVSLARVEAARLARSPLVLAGLILGGIALWVFIRLGQPMWWNSGWQIGYGQVIISLTVLIAAQLATARARRDGLQELYLSFPSSAGRRTLAHLIGLLGAVPACLLLIAAAAGVFALRGVVGTPDLAVLAGGILLVLAGGAIGVAIGSRFSHPLAGILGAFAWFMPFEQSNNISGVSTWLFPWVKPGQLNGLPGPLAGYPPAAAHALELAAIAALAAAVALTLTVAARRQRLGLMGAAAAALAVIVVACGVQLQPIATSNLDRLVSAVAKPGLAQRCTTTSDVRYCVYPAFGSLLPALQAPVNGVLAHVPVQRGRSLTISQASGVTTDDPTLTHGHSRQQVATWNALLQRAPANLPSSSVIYLSVGAWPASGQADARFGLALAAADWAVGLPTNTGTAAPDAQCIPVNQAREAIAIWLAAHATYLPAVRSQGVGGAGAAYTLTQVDGVDVVLWMYPGEYAGYFASPGPQTTAAGYLLAKAMTRLPADRVTAVLAASWDTWTSGHTTDSQLARALGITMPALPAGLVGASGGHTAAPPPGVPLQPVCTT